MNFLSKNMKFFLFMVFLLGLIFYGWKFLPQGASPHDQLIVGTASGYAPFVSLNEQCAYEGFDIDVAQELARRMGKKLVIKDLGSMTSLLIALKQNTIDLLMWGISITPERMKEYEFVHYQGETITSLPLVFWQKIPNDISSIEDLKKYPHSFIVAEPGSSNEAFLRQFDFIQLKPLEKIVDAILDIKYGKSLATLIDPSLVKELTRHYPELKILWIDLPASWYIRGNGIGINKQRGSFIKEVRETIQDMKNDGTIKSLEAKWNLQ